MAAMDFPNSPAVGDLFGSSGTVWRWDGSRWISTIGPSGPSGMVVKCPDVIASTNIGAATWTDITGASVSFTAIAGRTYKVSFSGYLNSNHGTATTAYLALTTSAGAELQVAIASLAGNPGPGDEALVHGSYIGAFTPGTVSLKLRGWFSAGAGNTAGGSSATRICQLIVEDITYEAGSSGNAGPWPLGIVSKPGLLSGSPRNLVAATPQTISNSVSFTYRAGRTYRVNLRVRATSPVSPAHVQFVLKHSGVYVTDQYVWQDGSYGGISAGVLVTFPTDTTHTVLWEATCAVACGVFVDGDPNGFYIEDLGVI